MFQPNKRQWRVIWTVATALVLLWPMGGSRSLAVKAVHLAADPFGRLPSMPPPLPMGLGDDGDAVMAYDLQVEEYYDAYDSSAWIRARMRMRDWTPGVTTATERQILVVIAVLAALLVWRLNEPERPPT